MPEDGKPLGGHIKVTREDWLAAALHVLIHDGVDQVKVLTLSARLGVSRSSFYWYFGNRQDLLDALLDHWQNTNTAALIAQAETPARTVTAAICNVHKCVVNTELFDTALDFAVRDWARRSDKVRRALDLSDARRLAALAEMFRRYDYPRSEAEARARVLYFMQIGYDLAQLGETPQQRLRFAPDYLQVFTGRDPDPEALEDFRAYTAQYWTLDEDGART